MQNRRPLSPRFRASDVLARPYNVNALSSAYPKLFSLVVKHALNGVSRGARLGDHRRARKRRSRYVPARFPDYPPRRSNGKRVLLLLLLLPAGVLYCRRYVRVYTRRILGGSEKCRRENGADPTFAGRNLRVSRRRHRSSADRPWRSFHGRSARWKVHADHIENSSAFIGRPSMPMRDRPMSAKNVHTQVDAGYPRAGTYPRRKLRQFGVS